MAMTIDNKTVQMNFDNRNFERNISQSMDSLKQMDNQLQDMEKSKSLETLNKQAQKVDFSNMSRGLEDVKAHFSTLQIAGMTVISDLTRSFMRFGSGLMHNIFGQIKQGGLTRALNLEQAEFQVKGLVGGGKKAVKTWKGLLKDVNYAVDDTAYGLDEAAKVASQLMASNIKIGPQMKAALRGVSGMAAMTGRSYSDIGNIYTKIAGNGRIMSQELLQFSASGLNAAATLTKFANSNKKARDHMIKLGLASKQKKAVEQFANSTKLTEQNIRTLVTAGAVDFKTFSKAMDKAFGPHAKKANETFTGSLANVKAALSRIGEPVATKAINRLRDIFNKLIPKLKQIKEGLKPVYKLIKNLIDQAYKGAKKVIKQINAKRIATFIKVVIKGIKAVVSAIKNIIKSFGIVAKSFKKGLFGDTLAEDVGGLFDRISGLFEKIFNYINEKKDRLTEIFSSYKPIIDNFISIIKTLYSVFTDSKSNDKAEIGNFFIAIGNTLSNLSDKVKKIVETLQPLFVSIVKLFKKMFKGIMDSAPKEGVSFSFFDSFIDVLGKVVDAITTFIDDLSNLNFHPIELLKTVIEKVAEAIKKAYGFLKKGISGIKKIAEGIKNPFMKVLKIVGGLVKKVFSYIGNAIKDLGKTIVAKNAMIVKGGIFVILVKQITKLIKAITDYISKKPEKAFDQLQKIPAKINGVFDSIASAVSSFKEKTKADNLKTTAQSVLMLAAALLILSTIDKDKLADGIAALTMLVTELAVVYKIINKNSKTIGFFQKSTTGGAESLIKLAAAVFILSGALLMISNLKPKQLTRGVITIGFLLGELVVALRIVSSNNKQYAAGATTIIAVAAAVRILTGAVKELGSLKTDVLIRGLIGVGALLGGLVAFMTILSLVTSKIGNKFMKSALSILIIVAAIRVLSGVVKELGSLKFEQIKQGLISIGLLLGGLIAFMTILSLVTSKIGNKFIKSAVSLVIIASALAILSRVVKTLGSMKFEAIKQGLLGIGALLLGVLVFVGLVSKFGSGTKMLLIATSLIIISTALLIFQKAIERLGTMSIDALTTGMKAFLTVLGSLVLFITLINSNMKGVLGLFVVANAVLILSAALLVLSTIPMIGLAVGVGALAAVFVVLGIAAKVLSPLIPSMLALAGAMAVVGLASVVLGTGLILIGAGLLTLSAGILDIAKNIDKVIKIIVNFITTLVTEMAKALNDLLPPITKILFQLIDVVIKLLTDTAPRLAEAIITLLLNVLQSLATNIGPIVTAIIDIIIGIFNGVADRIGDLFAAIGNLLGAIGQAIVDAIGNIDPAKVMNMLLAVGIIAALFTILSKLKSQMAQAIISVALMSVSLLILTGVFAIIGMIDNSITEKLNAITVFLAVMTLVLIGCAIIGNFAAQALIGLGVLIIAVAAITVVMAALGALADKLEPFIDKGGPLLVKVGSYIGQFIGAFIGGIAEQAVQALPALGDALGQFGQKIGPFTNAIKEMPLDMIVKIAALVAAVIAITATSFMNKITKFLSFGEDPIDSFIAMMIKLGKGLKKFNATIAGVDASGAETASNVLLKLAATANLIPSSGGWLQKFTGNKDLDGFGSGVVSLAKGLKTFVTSIDTSIDVAKYEPYVDLIKKMAEIANLIPSSGGWLQNLVGNKDLAGFGDSITPLAEGIKSFADQAVEIKDPSALNNVIDIIKKMVEIQNDLPESGGLWQAIAGSKDWDQLSEGLTSMVDCFKDISKSIGGKKGVNLENIQTAVNILKDVAKLNNDAIKITEKADKKSDEGDSETYVSKIIEPVKSAVTKIKEYQKTLKKEDMAGMVDYFKVLKEFVNKLGKEFSDKKTQKNLKIVKTIGDSIATLLDSVTKVKELMRSNDKGGKDKGKEGSLSEDLTAFANAIVKFSTDVGKLNQDGMKTAKKAVNTLKSMGDLKISKFENAKESVDNLKSALLAFKELNKKENKLTTGKKDKNDNQLGALKKYVKEIKKALTDFAKGLDTKGVKKKLKEISSFGKKMSTFSEGLKAVAGAFNSINKTGVNADKGTAVQKAMANVAKSGIEKFYKGLKGKKSKVEGAFKVLLKTTKTVAKDTFTANSFKTLGQNLIDGMIKGINDRTEDLKKSLALQITAGVKVTKKKAKSKSPSKVYDKIGQDLMAGEEQGIIKGGKKVQSTLATVTTDGIATTGKLVTSNNKKLLSNITKSTRNVRKHILSSGYKGMFNSSYGTNAYKGTFIDTFYSGLQKYYGNASENALDKLGKQARNAMNKAAVTLYKTTNPDQYTDEQAQLKKVNKRVNKNQKIVDKFTKKKSKAAKKDKHKSYKIYKKWQSKKGKKKKKYFKNHKKTLNKYIKAKKRLKDAKADKKELNKTISDNVKSTWQDLANTIKDNARSFMNPLEQAIDYGLNLFDKFERGQRISAGRMLANYASNVKGIERYNEALEKLKSRVSPEMYENLKSQGISALPQIEAINRMSGDQLSSLKVYEATNKRQNFELMMRNLIDRIEQAKSWRQKITELTKRGINKDALQDILNMGIEEAGPYIDALLAADSSQLRKFNDKFAEARKEEGNLAKAGMASYARSASGGINKEANQKAGSQASWNYAAGLLKGLTDKKTNSKIYKAAYKLASQIIKGTNKRLGIKSPAKEGAKAMMYVALGMAKGASDNLTLVQNAGEELADAVLNPLQSMETAQNTIEENPTITPIIDLDRLERDFDKIDSMFSNEYALGITADIANGKKLATQSTKSGDIINNYNNEFTQNNYSPEPLDRVGIYRDTKGWINSKMKGGVATT